MFKNQSVMIFVLLGLLAGRIARNTVLKQSPQDVAENKPNLAYLLYLAGTAFGSWYSWKDVSLKAFFVGAFGGNLLDYVADRIKLESQTKGIEPRGLGKMLVNESPTMYVNASMYVNSQMYVNCMQDLQQTETVTETIYDDVCKNGYPLKISLL